jgi:hypothetical protein
MPLYDGINGLDDAKNTWQMGFDSDQRESDKLDPYIPRPDGDSRPWWERVAEYGLTRAIDSNFGPPAVNKTQTGGTFAGQNGLTYPISGPTSSGRDASVGPGNGTLVLVAVAALAAFLLAG